VHGTTLVVFREREPHGTRHLLANALLASLYWLIASRGWLPRENFTVITWIAVFSVAGILAIGMSWASWRGAQVVTRA
jgi:hypothetical protein